MCIYLYNQEGILVRLLSHSQDFSMHLAHWAANLTNVIIDSDWWRPGVILPSYWMVFAKVGAIHQDLSS